MNPAQRISDSADLGRRNRSFDIALGSVAVLPIIGASIDVWIAGPEALEVKTLAIEWSGGLLMFFAGVRRGLTFSEVSGGSPFELATMVWLFCLGMAALILISILRRHPRPRQRWHPGFLGGACPRSAKLFSAVPSPSNGTDVSQPDGHFD